MSVSDGPIRHLGLGCPQATSFYICHDAKIRFLGCCDEDPCAHQVGNCSATDLSSANFDGSKSEDIPRQACIAPYTDQDWYACPDGSFIGCCKTDPCGGGCPAGDIIGARMSDDDTAAAIFSAPGERSTSTSSTPTSSSATSSSTFASTSVITTSGIETTPTSTPSPDQVAGSESNGTPAGSIIGGTVGGVAALTLIVAFLFLYFRRRAAARRGKLSAAEDQIEASQPPWDPYKGSGNLGVVQELPSIECPSELPNATDGRALTVSYFSGDTPELDSRHVSYSTTGSLPPSDHPPRQHPSLNPVSELEGSTNVRDGDER
ncbi:hypothetical protein F5Y13DRAFT_169923 [Hypoxylon sp. FL1857]|nr:hypothetical protein F5Y13DRAFT_169923 [Hypoxylon sp. FL1857]